MTVYHKSSSNMSEINDESIHLIVTSPPYPMISKWDNHYGIVDFEIQHHRLLATWIECYRVLVNGGIACINIGDATRSIDGEFQCYPNYAQMIMMLKKLQFIPLIPILWKKISNRPNAFLGSGFLPPNGYISQDCEYIAILRKGTLRKFPPKDPIRYESAFTKEERDLWFQQIWNIPGAKGAKKDSSFPEEIPYRLIRMYSVISDTVLDPFAGTGTTGIVAERIKRNYIGYTLPEPNRKRLVRQWIQ